jgi:hypothetical protein
MKTKIYLSFLIITSFLINSCSSDVNQNENNILPKRIEIISSSGTETINYEYFENKIIKETRSSDNDNIRIVFSFYYTNNLITKVDESHTLNVTNNSDYTYNFFYNAQENLAQDNRIYLNNTPPLTSTTNYTYSSNIISYSNNIATLSPDNKKIVNLSDNYYNVNYTYTYDDKNNPFNNIVGYNKLAASVKFSVYLSSIYHFQFYGSLFSRTNLIEGKKQPQNGIQYTELLNQYIYNSDNYPTKITSNYYNPDGSIFETITYNIFY